MNALYIDFNIRYVNPTRNLLVELNKSIFDKVSIYGPGYTNEEDLKSGILNFIKKKGPFDYIVTNESVFFSSNGQVWDKESLKDLYKSHSISFPKSNFSKEIIIDITNFLLECDKKLIIYMLQTDFYNIRIKQIELLKKINNPILITFGEDLISKTSELQYLSKEKFYKQANDNWYDFIRENSEKIISIPHFLRESEFSWHTLENRSNNVTIPGVDYWFRKEIKLISKKKSIYKYNNFLYPLSNLLLRFNISFLSSDMGINLINNSLRHIISNSKFSFTCGSALKWPLRKFFEIPALGTVLLCYPFKSARNHGFIDGDTCICIDSPEDFNYKIKHLLGDKKTQNKIANNGREMVYSRHLISNRSKKIKSFL